MRKRIPLTAFGLFFIETIFFENLRKSFPFFAFDEGDIGKNKFVFLNYKNRGNLGGPMQRFSHGCGQKKLTKIGLILFIN